MNKIKPKKELGEKLTELMTSMEDHTHLALIQSFDSTYQLLAKEFCSQMIREYGCQTSLEKSLVEVIANSYIRTIETSKRLNNCLNANRYIDDASTRYLAMLSKQIDRSNRQFLSGIIALKQLMSPAVEVNVKTKNAFIAQNQQINSDYKPKPTKNENNESK